MPPPLGITGKLPGADSSGTGYKTISTTSFSIPLDKGMQPLKGPWLHGLWDASLFYTTQTTCEFLFKIKRFYAVNEPPG